MFLLEFLNTPLGLKHNSIYKSDSTEKFANITEQIHYQSLELYPNFHGWNVWLGKVR